MPLENSERSLTRILSSSRIPEEGRAILRRIALERWGGEVDPDAIEVVQLKGAMTNEVYQVKWPTAVGPSRKALVRIYGQGVEVFFDRETEIRTFKCMSDHGQGPSLLGRFATGRVEEFIKARTLSASDLRDPEISALIAMKLREFHNLPMPGPKHASLWNNLRNWLREACVQCPPEEAQEFQLDRLSGEITALEKLLSLESENIGFCHNDLQYGNLMMDEETKQVTIIDYEYASYNPIPFDIANHFCEMTANYHTETPHVLDFTKYPDSEEQTRFVTNYLRSSDAEPSSIQVQKMLGYIDKYTLASHLFWGLWGIISEHVNTAIEFDYKEYARQRFERYWSTKSAILGVS